MFGRKNKNQLPPPRRSAAPVVRQNVFSYHASRSPSESNTGRTMVAQDAPQWSFSLARLQNLPMILSISVMVFAFLYALTLNTNPQVAIVDDTDTSLKHSAAQYQSYAVELSKKSLLNQFKLTIDTDGMSKQLRQQFPELETADITVPILGRRTKVHLTTVSPLFQLTDRTGKSYYIASDGRATSPIDDYVAQPKDTVLIQDQSGVAITPGQQILTTDTVDFINQVIAQAKAQNQPITSFELPTNPYELRMRPSGQKYYVKFNMLGDARVQVGDYFAVQSHLTGEGQLPAEYIDARVEGKVFYK